jgi:hypothetical protein
MAAATCAARDVQAADVVQPAVVRLADERVDRPDVLVAGLGQRPADDDSMPAATLTACW